MKQKVDITDWEFIENTSKVYYTGSVWETNNGGPVTVVGKVRKNPGKYSCHFLIEFSDGTRVCTGPSSLRRGQLRNPNQPSFMGKGYLGQGPWKYKIKDKITKEGSTWSSVLKRVFSPKYHNRFPTYKDCKVDPSWLCFQTFCEDILSIPGYAEWKTNTLPKAWHLDKDVKIPGNKVYSKDTCMFIPQEENISASGITGLTYVATRLRDNYQEEFTIQRHFSKKYNIRYKNVNKCLMGYAKTHKGWTFKVKEEENKN